MARRYLAAASAALLFSSTVAQQQQHHLSQHCPSSDICYSINIPKETATSGNGDIYFQMAGSTAYSWVGLGQGSQMKGANIFVMYADGTGNVTVSPRLGVGHVQPLHDTAADITVLEGSGIRNGMMIANVLCRNCASWSGGSMDFSASNANWIYAAKSGSALDTTATDAQISEHTEHGDFTWEFTPAQGGRDVNPFVNVQGTPVSSGPPSGSSSSAGSSGSGSASQSPSAPEELIIVHGSLASMAFLALFPIGSILLRIPGLQNAIWIHAAVQTLAYISFIAAVGLGIYCAKIQEQLMDYHPIIGLVLFALLFFQPWWGLFHHLGYKKHQMRTGYSYLHIWEGRICILLGMINGGFGLQLVGLIDIPGKKGYVNAYIIVAAVMGTLFITNIIYSEVVRRRTPRKKDLSPTSTKSEGNGHANGGANRV